MNIKEKINNKLSSEIQKLNNASNNDELDFWFGEQLDWIVKYNSSCNYCGCEIILSVNPITVVLDTNKQQIIGLSDNQRVEKDVNISIIEKLNQHIEKTVKYILINKLDDNESSKCNA